jgi:hypothetical protein
MKKRQSRVYVLNDDDRERIDQMIYALRCALDVVFDRREADLDGKGTAGTTEFDRQVDEALWVYGDGRDPDF